MTNEYNFKVGDKVRNTYNGELGRITSVTIDTDGDVDGCDVLFDDGIEEWMSVYEIELVEDTPYDPQEDFLTRLKALLEEFNAEIGYSPDNAIGVKIDKTAYSPIELWWDMPSKKWAITADNIMDFDKE